LLQIPGSWWAELPNLILGILGSSGAVVGGTSYESIATVTLGSSNSTIEFTSIPSTYKHLQLRVMSPSGSYATLRFNNDTTTSNYRYHYVLGTGAGSPSAGSVQNAYFPTAGAWSQPHVGIMDILDYTSTSKNKTVKVLEGFDANGSGEIYLTSNLWMNSSNAITSIKIIAQGSAFGLNSSFALYGIKD